MTKTGSLRRLRRITAMLRGKPAVDIVVTRDGPDDAVFFPCKADCGISLPHSAGWHPEGWKP